MASRVVDILLQQGRDAANAQLASGAAWGGAVQQLGQIPGQVLAANEPYQEAQARQKARQMQQMVAGLSSQAMTPGKPGQPPTFDRGKLQQLFTQHNVPLDLQAQQLQSLDTIDSSAAKFAQARIDHAADLAHAVQQQIKAGADPHDAMTWGLAYAKGSGFMTDEQLQPIYDHIAQGGDIPSMLSGMKGLSEKYKSKPIALAQGGTLVTEEGQTIAQGQPKPPTSAEVALKAAGGDPIAAKAAAIMHPQTTPTDLAIRAASGDETAKAALKLSKTPEQAPTQVEHQTREEDLARAREAREAADSAARIRLETARVNLERARLAMDDPTSPKNQAKLEQQYRTVLTREISSRSGGLGLEDGKVNQANHLLALMDQYQGKPMPTQIQAELALGLARLTSPNGQVGIELEREFNQRTAQGSMAKATAWLTGDPSLVNATPEKLREMFRDSITRQGQVAVQNREGYFKTIRGFAPTDLSQQRREQLEKDMGLNPLRTTAEPGTTQPKATHRYNPATGKIEEIR